MLNNKYINRIVTDRLCVLENPWNYCNSVVDQVPGMWIDTIFTVMLSTITINRCNKPIVFLCNTYTSGPVTDLKHRTWSTETWQHWSEAFGWW